MESGAPAAPIRERILDEALELFATKGYAETSLREIAERVGVSKAALYYHFESKQDIMAALHYRMHRLTDELQPALEVAEHTDSEWNALVEQLITIGLRHRRLLEVHLRNQGLISDLHSEAALAKHPRDDVDADGRLLALMADPSAPLEVRVRRMASLGAIGGVLLSAASFTDVSDDDLRAQLVAVVEELLRV